MYKQATQLKLRFSTSVGLLSVEQLWDLSMTNLSNAIKAVKKVLKKNDDDELSFLEDAKIVDTENELRFNILKDVYLTKKSMSEALQAKKDKDAHNQKIYAKMAANNEKEQDNMTNAELEKLLIQ